MPRRMVRVCLVSVIAIAAVACAPDKPEIVSSSTVSTEGRGGQSGRTSGYPGTGDHLHIAYGIYLCDTWLPPLSDLAADITGIHTHTDGVIHVHPFADKYGGDNATLAVFGDIVDLEFNGRTVELPDETSLPDDYECGGGPSELAVLTASADDPTNLVPTTFDPGDVPLNADRGVLVLAAVAPGTIVPPPPSVATLDELSDLPSRPR